MTSLLTRRAVAISSLATVLALVNLSDVGRAFQAPPAPSIRIRAVSDDGQPVLDLKPADIALKIGGKLRAVTGLKLVKIAEGAAAPAAAAAKPAASSSSLPEPFATNAGPSTTGNTSGDPGRVIVIVVDELSIAPGKERALQESVTQLISVLSPNDRVGMRSMPSGKMNFAPSVDRDRILTAINGYAGQAVSGEDDDARNCRTGVMLKGLRDLVQTTPTDDPQTVVMFSSGVMGPSVGDSTAAKSKIAQNETCNVNQTDYLNYGAAMQATPQVVYAVHIPDAAPSFGSDTAKQMADGMSALTNAMNGTLLRFVGKGEGVMARLMKETSAYYVASFDADPSDKPGTPVRVEVKIARDKIRTRAQTQYAPEAAAGPTKAGMKPADMIKDMKAFRDLPLRATSFAGKGTEGKVTVTTFVESGDGAAALNAVTVGLIDDKGKLIAQCSMQPADLQKADQAKQPAIAACIAPEGSYRLRVAATDANARAGAVDEQFNGTLTKAGASFKASSLMLFAQAAGGISPRLQFKDETDAVALFYLYGTLVQGLGAKGEVLGADGKVIGDPFPFGVSGNPSPDQVALAAKVPLASLAPGDYTVRVTIITPDTPETFLSKTLRKIK